MARGAAVRSPGVLGGRPSLGWPSTPHLLLAQWLSRGGGRAGSVGTGRCTCKAQVLLLHGCWAQSITPGPTPRFPQQWQGPPPGPTANQPDSLWPWDLGPTPSCLRLPPGLKLQELCGFSYWTGAERLLTSPERRAHLRLGLELWGTWLGGRAGEDSCCR